MEEDLKKSIQNGDAESLNELKRWLFAESIRLELKQKEMDEIQSKFLKERQAYIEEMNAINLRNVNEMKRLKQEELFFDKKMAILQSGFAALEEDRKKLQKEKIAFETEKSIRSSIKEENAYRGLAGSLFAGVTNPLALKKRYRDLLKIFHPDNLCGDTDMVAYINKEYEALKESLDYSFKSAR